MARSNILPPSNQVTRSLRQTMQETPLSADTFPRLGKVSPHSQPSPRYTRSPRCITFSRSTSQIQSTAPSHGVQPTILCTGHRLPIDCPPLRPLDLSISHLRSRVDSSRTDPTRSSPSLRLSVFRGFNVLPRKLLTRTRKQTLGLRIHGPLVLG